MTALWLDPDVEPHGPVGPLGAPDLRLDRSRARPRPDEWAVPGRDGSGTSAWSSGRTAHGP